MELLRQASIIQAVGLTKSDSQTILELLSIIREDTAALNESVDDPPQTGHQEAKVEKIEQELSQLETLLNEFKTIDAAVLVSPFRSETKSIAMAEIQPSDFYAPAVIALLMQHLAVTFAALSIVQERRAGTMELFRVSPVSAFETVLGKYLSYLLFAGILGAILTLAVIYGLRVPMLGDWFTYSLSLAALIFASLGIGFVISLVARSDSEAVQYSMIVLLTSVFFSGAFVRLQALWEPVHGVSWSMPATYGVLFLQNIMLWGFLPSSLLLISLATLGIALFGVAWFLLSRLMARS